MNRRQWLSEVKNILGEVDTAIEVGVWLANYSVNICDTLSPKKFYGIDPYVSYDNAPGMNKGYENTQALEETYQKACARLPSYATLIRDFSVNAAEQFENESIDFVYIDGDHNYESVSADIEAWYPKIKSGGIISGHDYIEKNVKRDIIFGIIPAVTEFCQKYNKQISLTSEEYATWWCVK